MRLIDQLEQRGLVTRAADPTDRRRHRIELTAAGRKLIRADMPIAETAEAAHLQTLSASERRTLVDLLGRVLESQDQLRAEGAANGGPRGG